MIDKEKCIYFGRIRKTSGYQGEVILSVDVALPEDLAVFEFFHLEIEGDLIPFFIEEIDIAGPSGIRVKFIDVPTQEKAKSLIDCPVYVEEIHHKNLRRNSLLIGIEGFMVVDARQGEIGKLVRVIQQTVQDLLVVKAGEAEILIPVAEAIILRIDPEKRSIFVDLPEGLTELNL